MKQQNNIKVSFDFDSTLAKKDIQEYTKSLIDNGIEVHIVTDRFDDTTRCSYTNDYLYKVADELCIDRKNIHFMNMTDKYKFFLQNSDFIWHLDDDDIAMEFINFETTVICVYNNIMVDWKQICNDILKKYTES